MKNLLRSTNGASDGCKSYDKQEKGEFTYILPDPLYKYAVS